MPLAKTSYMSLLDYSTGNVEKKTVSGAIKFCERPPAASPLWLVIASDAGEIRVFNEAGVYQAAHSFDLGWNPDQVAINNADPPRILVRRASNLGLYCYLNGALEWSVTSITGLARALISDGWVVALMTSTATAQVVWRSLTDGSVDTSGTAGTWAYSEGLAVTESGEKAFWINWQGIAATERMDIVCDDRTAGNVFRSALFSSDAKPTYSEFRIRCDAPGSLVLWSWYRSVGTPSRYVMLTTGTSPTSLYTANPTAQVASEVNPAGTRACYVDGSTLYELTALGAVSSVALGASRAANEGCLDLTDDPYFTCGLNNGNIEIYDDALAKKATISYELSDTPMAVVRRTS